jgi:hypothetical protein
MSLRTRPAGPRAADVRPLPGGVGRGTSPEAEAVSDALRRQDSPHLTARRRVAALQMISTAALGVVGLYQFGLIRTMPEPSSLPGIDADAVDAAGEAYQLGHTPDSTLGMASSAVTSCSPAWAAPIEPPASRSSPWRCSPRRSSTPSTARA